MSLGVRLKTSPIEITPNFFSIFFFFVFKKLRSWNVLFLKSKLESPRHIPYDLDFQDIHNYLALLFVETVNYVVDYLCRKTFHITQGIVQHFRTF